MVDNRKMQVRFGLMVYYIFSILPVGEGGLLFRLIFPVISTNQCLSHILLVGPQGHSQVQS